jgi:hypothetical protein
MKTVLLIGGICVALAISRPAYAQSAGAFDADDAVAPISIVEGPGVKVGEGTVLHPVFGLETGFNSNVFYQDQNPTGAGVLRLMAQVGAGSLPLTRLAPPIVNAQTEFGEDEAALIRDAGDFQYRADVRLAYDALLSGNEVVQKTGGLGAGATFRGLVNPLRTWSFGFDEDFHRLIRAANFETDADTNRDINYLFMQLMFQPRGRAISALLKYENTIDVFEQNTQGFANRMLNTFGLRGMYQWLPVTRVSLNATQSIYTGLGDSTKVTSYPLKAYAGLESLLSLNTTFVVNAGATAGFYSQGQSFVGPLLEAQFGYRYSPLGRFTLEYEWVYVDSVNANYYRDNMIRGWIQQAFVPFVIVVQPEVHFREYVDTIVPDVNTGSRTRDDVIVSVLAGIHYNFRNWWAFTADYHFSTVQTDFQYMPTNTTGAEIVNPSYARHELMFGTRIAM